MVSPEYEKVDVANDSAASVEHQISVQSDDGGEYGEPRARPESVLI
jgi:hypothetical protein